MNQRFILCRRRSSQQYRAMYRASEGCLLEYIRRGCMDADAMGKDFRRLSEFWKMICLRKNREEAGDER